MCYTWYRVLILVPRVHVVYFSSLSQVVICQSCVGTRARLGYDAFDAQLRKAYLHYTVRYGYTYVCACASTRMPGGMPRVFASGLWARMIRITLFIAEISYNVHSRLTICLPRLYIPTHGVHSPGPSRRPGVSILNPLNTYYSITLFIYTILTRNYAPPFCWLGLATSMGGGGL